MGISTRLSPSYAVRFWVGWLVQLLRGCTSLLVGWYTITWLVHFLLWQAAKPSGDKCTPYKCTPLENLIATLQQLDCHATATWLPRCGNMVIAQRQHGYRATVMVRQRACWVCGVMRKRLSVRSPTSQTMRCWASVTTSWARFSKTFFLRSVR